MKNFSYSKLIDEKIKYSVLCSCSCRVIFYPFQHKTKKVCKWCGKTVYINEQTKFKDLLLQKKKELENES